MTLLGSDWNVRVAVAFAKNAKEYEGLFNRLPKKHCRYKDLF